MEQKDGLVHTGAHFLMNHLPDLESKRMRFFNSWTCTQKNELFWKQRNWKWSIFCCHDFQRSLLWRKEPSTIIQIAYKNIELSGTAFILPFVAKLTQFSFCQFHLCISIQLYVFLFLSSSVGNIHQEEENLTNLTFDDGPDIGGLPGPPPLILTLTWWWHIVSLPCPE